MKSTIMAASALLVATAAAAQPHAHQHQKLHDKRAIVWKTETEVVTETIPITTTIWVTADDLPATSSESGSAGLFFETTTAIVPAPSTAAKPATPSSSSTPVIPPAPAPTPSVAEVVPAARLQKTSTTPVAVPVAPTTPTLAPPATTTPAAPAAAPAPASGYTGVCASGTPCTGDITFYTAGLGACGIVSDGDTQRVVALPFGLMGALSNSNPYCGMTITISHDGKTTNATVVDKCMGCIGDSIDLSTLAFGDLADFAVGRTTATWHFN